MKLLLRGGLCFVMLFLAVSFVRSQASEWLFFKCGNGLYLTELYKVRSDGSDLEQLTNYPLRMSSPRVSSDGTWLVFAAQIWNEDYNAPGSDIEIHKIRADGSEFTQLTDNRVTDHSPTLSPDGQQIAFVSNRDEAGTHDIYTMRLDGSDIARVTNGLHASSLEWSPDGNWIAFVANSNLLYVVPPDGSQLRQLARTNRYLFSPTWSPDSTAIAFSSDLTAINRVTVDGTGLQQLATSDKNPAAAWSPDGTKLALVTLTSTEEILTIVDQDGGNPQTILRTTGQISYPRWSLDGGSVFFSYGRYEDGELALNWNWQIYKADLEQQQLEQITFLSCHASLGAVSAG